MTVDLNSILKSRSDLDQYGDNARLLFALETRFQIEDIHTVAANALTDNPDDKKSDLVYVDRDSGTVVIAQGYEGKKEKASAPSNKASDLNTAVAWLFARDLADLPEGLRSAAKELRSALGDGVIRDIQLWYVHNQPESQNVKAELISAEHTVNAALKTHFSQCEITSVSALEVGNSVLTEWYRAVQTPILVTDSFSIECNGGYHVRGNNWEAYVTSVSATWLHKVYSEHKSDLFSANLRGYLGSKPRDSNINYGIKQTASKDPEHLWVFNNGITALVNDFQVTRENDLVKIEIKGLSIVNGAQTTGAIGSLNPAPVDTAQLQTRFVKCSTRETILDLITFNNSQNRLEAADFRSNDPIQKRLRKEFESIPNAEYLGGRRGGHEDVARRIPNLLSTDTCAQALATFHQDPVVAYNQRTRIWTDDVLYAKYFSDHTHADHIVFVYGLLRSVENKKMALRGLDIAKLTETQREQLQFLRQRGSIFILTAAVAKCLELFLGKAIPNSFRASFGAKASPNEAEELWKAIVDVTIPFCKHLQPAVENVLNNAQTAAKAIDEFKSIVESVSRYHDATFKEFASHVKTE